MALGWAHNKNVHNATEKDPNKAVKFFSKPPLFGVTVSKGKHQKCRVFLRMEGNIILICMTG